jgi:hypothetical protein
MPQWGWNSQPWGNSFGNNFNYGSYPNTQWNGWSSNWNGGSFQPWGNNWTGGFRPWSNGWGNSWSNFQPWGNGWNGNTGFNPWSTWQWNNGAMPWHSSANSINPWSYTAIEPLAYGYNPWVNNLATPITPMVNESLANINSNPLVPLYTEQQALQYAADDIPMMPLPEPQSTLLTRNDEYTYPDATEFTQQGATPTFNGGSTAIAALAPIAFNASTTSSNNTYLPPAPPLAPLAPLPPVAPEMPNFDEPESAPIYEGKLFAPLELP